MPKQLNVFVENRPGRLKSVTEALSKNRINIIAFTVQDRKDFGLMKLIVDKPKQAYLALADKGYACALRDILAISVKDKPGNLYKLTALLFKHKINIIDAHGFVIEPDKQGICCLEVDTKDTKKLKKILAKQGFKSLEEEIHEF
jgi:hypothetical protein